MPELDDAAYDELAKLLRQRVAALAPDWTDNNESDPGIALLELFAFLTESILYRANQIPERGRARAARLAQVAQALANDNAGQASHVLERTRYFFGRLLGVDDFRLEQDYFRERLRRLNRELQGYGVVRGLGVSVRHDDSGTSEVVVEPGFAIDARGEEIEVCVLATAGLPPTGQLLYVTLHHAERPTHPQPAVDGEAAQFGRIEEGFAVRLEAAPAGDAVALARLLRAQNGWRVDETFKPARVAARAR
jgi:hypothetical protein